MNKPPEGFRKAGVILKRRARADHITKDEFTGITLPFAVDAFSKDVMYHLRTYTTTVRERAGVEQTYRYLHEPMEFFIHVQRHDKDGEIQLRAQFWEKDSTNTEA